jgi:hypothetical protein
MKGPITRGRIGGSGGVPEGVSAHVAEEEGPAAGAPDVAASCVTAPHSVILGSLKRHKT